MSNNVLVFKAKPKLVPVQELGGTPLGWYKCDLKGRLLVFIGGIIRELKDDEAIKILGVDETEISLIKNMRVSQFDLDRLFDIIYKLGYGIHLESYALEENNDD